MKKGVSILMKENKKRKVRHFFYNVMPSLYVSVVKSYDLNIGSGIWKILTIARTNYRAC